MESDVIVSADEEVKENSKGVEDYTTLKQGMLNTNFEIDLPYDIASNNMAHSINIKNVDLPTQFKNYAVPKLDQQAYLVGELTNWENLDLLPGKANIIMDDTYIGVTQIDPNTALDTLNLSLGKDKRIYVKRMLVKEESKLSRKDNDITQTFTYELTVRNNKSSTVDFVLKDQYPLSSLQNVEVKVLSKGNADIENKEVGSLTWKLILKPGESRNIKFSYQIKYPKDKKISNI
jgi:uncharacterized protein (TIGR02231 family)